MLLRQCRTVSPVHTKDRQWHSPGPASSRTQTQLPTPCLGMPRTWPGSAMGTSFAGIATSTKPTRVRSAAAPTGRPLSGRSSAGGPVIRGMGTSGPWSCHSAGRRGWRCSAIYSNVCCSPPLAAHADRVQMPSCMIMWSSLRPSRRYLCPPFLL